uniref:ATP synthase subunit a n=1 Tax=Pyrops clavatus TaxID=2873973 RepID=A0A9E8G386_9HEMI|nr:ATP synthase F0 subunit 6 [Pyrops clavatus]UAT98595.1 ATP synthase F0 subunit 6 [Pyrops clavatus]UZT27042.1 ATP synthase F0 subunit 6 [Pyrops clavatus]
MMTSLFSTFDPTTSMMQMNWLIMITPMIILPKWFWIKKSRWNKMMKLVEKKLTSEFKTMTHHKEMMIMSTSVFIFIMMMNIMGLFPYIYTATSHLSISLSIALPMWLMMNIYGWTSFTNNMFKHMLPKGTPLMISPMMIMIETIGNLIRPISLSVRLTANMIAGHLLMTLLGNTASTEKMLITLPMQMMLMAFESSISIIQAYVLSTLLTLYSSEIP